MKPGSRSSTAKRSRFCARCVGAGGGYPGSVSLRSVDMGGTLTHTPTRAGARRDPRSQDLYVQTATEPG